MLKNPGDLKLNENLTRYESKNTVRVPVFLLRFEKIVGVISKRGICGVSGRTNGSQTER